MKQNNDFLGTEPIGKLLWKLSIPAIAAQIINLLYNLVDRQRERCASECFRHRLRGW